MTARRVLTRLKKFLEPAMFCHLAVERQCKRPKVHAKQKGFKNFFKQDDVNLRTFELAYPKNTFLSKKESPVKCHDFILTMKCLCKYLKKETNQQFNETLLMKT